MKSTALFLAAALFAAPVSAETPAAETSFFSTASWSASSFTSSGAAPVMRSRSASSLLYTDGAGRLTAFSMEMEDQVMTITIRQDGAVVARRSFPADSDDFSVSRREGAGRVYFLITAGTRTLVAEPDSSGLWTIRPAEDDPSAAVPL